MRRLLIVTLLLMPHASWGNGTKTEDDICQAQKEAKIAQDSFDLESRHYNGESLTMLASEVDRTRLRFMQLRERYKKKYGKPFKGDCHGGYLPGQVVK